MSERTETQNVKKCLNIIRQDQYSAKGGKLISGRIIDQLVNREHRTNQQTTMRNFVVPLIKEWARKRETGQFDPRNKNTVKVCVRIVQVLEEEGLAVFPLI